MGSKQKFNLEKNEVINASLVFSQCYIGTLQHNYRLIQQYLWMNEEKLCCFEILDVKKC